MSEFVADTHALHWHLARDPRLSATARSIFDVADAGHHRIFVASISLVEMVYLAERGRLGGDLVFHLAAALADARASYQLAPLDLGTVDAIRRISRSLVPDMPDRIIAATALQLDLPLITRDARIARSRVVRTVW